MSDSTYPIETQEPTRQGDDAEFSCLVMIYGEHLGRQFLIQDEPLLIGRAPNCDVELSDGSVSRNHCRIVPEKNRVMIIDLGSTNKTLVNGVAIREQALEDGDRIAVGRGIFKFLRNDNIETAYHEEIARVMTTDPLTGAFNRAHFEKEIDYTLYRYQRYGRPVSLVMMDIDLFKEINDRHGHLAGDRVLTQLGNLIFSCLRAGDIFARWGGEEFALLLPETELAGALTIAERLRRRIDDTEFHFVDTKISVTLSMGVAQIDESVTESNQLLAISDERLYEAKEAGRNCVRPDPAER